MHLPARAAALGACLALAGCLSVPTSGDDAGGGSPGDADAGGSPGCTPQLIDEFLTLDNWGPWATGAASYAIEDEQLRFALGTGGSSGATTIATFTPGGLRITAEEGAAQAATVLEVMAYDANGHAVIAQRDGGTLRVLVEDPSETTTLWTEEAPPGPWVFEVDEVTTIVATPTGQEVQAPPRVRRPGPAAPAELPQQRRARRGLDRARRVRALRVARRGPAPKTRTPRTRRPAASAAARRAARRPARRRRPWRSCRSCAWRCRSTTTRRRRGWP